MLLRTQLLAPLLGIVLGSAFPGLARAQTTIDFDLGGPCLFQNTVPLGAEYAGLGVTFSGAVAGNGGAILDTCSFFGFEPLSGTDFLAFSRSGNTQTGVPEGPQVIEFASPVQTVSIWAAVAYLKDASFQMEAFLGGVSVDVDVEVSEDDLDTWSLLLVSHPDGIDRVVLSESGYEGWAFDDLVFSDTARVGEDYCDSDANSTERAAAIYATGSASVAANDLVLSADGVPNQPGLFFYGPNQVSIPFGNGERCVGGILGRLPVANASGEVLTHPLDNTVPPNASTAITPGSTWHFQAWFRDPGVGAGFDLSDGLTISFEL